jgi:uncharacterized protein YbaR (Trm112 family)
MFIELAEHLRCPEGHEERAYCVLVPDEMAGRDVVRGSIACPVCEHVYPLRDGIADFSGTAPATATPIEASSSPGSPIAPDVAQALLGVAGPGGYVVLLGSAGRVATELAGLMEGIHFIGVNAPPDVVSSPTLSLVRGADKVPLASSMARGVVVGPEMVRRIWLAESMRVLLRGLRIVVCQEEVTVPDAEPMAAGNGIWVGKKR